MKYQNTPSLNIIFIDKTVFISKILRQIFRYAFYLELKKKLKQIEFITQLGSLLKTNIF